MRGFLLVASLATLLSAGVLGAGKNATTDARLGLLASSLGVPPVPGASYGGGGDETLYSGGGGGDYGGGAPVPPPAPIRQCKCTPKHLCVDPNAGGVYPPPTGGGGGDYGGNQGGGGGPNYGGGGSHGGNGGPDYGNQGGGGGPNYGGGNQGGGGGPNYGGGNQGGGGGPNYGGGNQGGGGGPNYGGGNQGGGKVPDYGGGNQGGGLIDPNQPGGQHGGNGGPGYGPDGGGTDGAGLIDVRIVNKPPGGVVCLAGEVYCCNQGTPQTGGPYPIGPDPPYQPGPGPQSPHGCGVRKIINVPGFKPEYGQAQFGAYPWMAVMLGPSNNYLGAGAVIDSYHVLTAAHKIADYKGSFKVRFGEWNAQDDSEPYKNVEIDIARVDIHPAFNPKNLQNDVAIITLAQPVSLEAFPHIKSACLPAQGSNFVGHRCWVAGFGKDAFQVGKHSYIMREVDVPVVESNECELRLRGTRLGSYFTLNRKSFLCAGGEEGKDACTGDGGSPLVCEYNGRFTVVGLVAWGIGCADYGIPGVYVNVPNYVNWIESKLDTQYPSNPKPSY